jgi:hypothetical protein
MSLRGVRTTPSLPVENPDSSMKLPAKCSGKNVLLKQSLPSRKKEI